MAIASFPSLISFLRSAVFSTLCFFALTTTANATADAESAYVDQLQEKAHRLKLSEQRNWQILLHYKRTLAGGYQSRISDPRFFLSPTGVTDPQAELDATLAGFFQPDAPDGKHPICRFPARLQYLSEQLDIDPAKLPAASCSAQQELIKSVDARSAVLVFPVGHINSPASMFGHTLIRIDGSSKSRLISYAVNYAAETLDSNGLLYAVKGLSGQYKGYYSLMPYYLKVKEYGDMEHRDIWEYRLKLTQDEVDRMLRHTLELEQISSDYYFLDENCSYNLLFLIEAARPTLHLSDRTGLLVLPTNTIQIARESGILEEAEYRPSQGARIAKIASLMDEDNQQLALELAQAKRDPASVMQTGNADVEKRELLDLAAELVQLRLARKELAQEEYSKLYLKILAQRSKLGSNGEELYLIEQPAPPHTGHRTTKIGVGGGARRGDWYGEIHLQPGFHGLLDPDQGFLRGAQIKYLDTAIAYAPETDRLWLKTLHLLDILSLAPRNQFFKPYSWKVAVGWDTEVMENGADSLIFRLNTGGGMSKTSPWGGILYAFGELDVNAGKRLRGTVAAGPGVSVGALEQVKDWWKVQLGGQAFYYCVGDDRLSLKATLAQNFRLAQNSSLGVEYTAEHVDGHFVPQATILWNYYF
jgi:hypothetical protein